MLKPSSDHTSQVVLNGKPVGNMGAYDYFRKDEGRDVLRKEVNAAFDRLSSRYNPIVMEGAGSISELNLRDTDLVNLPMARYAGARVILVADIDRGGVFASAYGSIALQTPEDKKLIKGIIINKFRGDLRLFEEGRKILEDICKVPVLGVVPYFKDIHIEEEDSMELAGKQHSAVSGRVNVAVILLRHISNFTDFGMLERDPRVNLYYTNNVEEIGKADIIILPGTKSTIDDLYEIRRNGVAEAVLRAHKNGTTVLGICGGYQMMGMSVDDPQGVEGSVRKIPGLGLLPVDTVMEGSKVTRQVSFRFRDLDGCTGYEIHMGRTEAVGGADCSALNVLADGSSDGCFVDDRTFGTYIHGILDNQQVIESLLAPFAGKRDTAATGYFEFKQQQYDLLADHVRRHLDMPLLYKIMSEDD